jgi:hypothetical protein
MIALLSVLSSLLLTLLSKLLVSLLMVFFKTTSMQKAATRLANDQTLQANIDAEETARIAGDAANSF